MSILNLKSCLLHCLLFSEADTEFSKRRGVGCHAYGYFILVHFVAGHIMWYMDKRWVDKTLDDKMPDKLAREDKMLAILWDRVQGTAQLGACLISCRIL